MEPSKEVDTVNPFCYSGRVGQVTDKPLRKDAERNRRLILDAAMELFAQRGLGVTLNDIAHHAGVGVGTVYRRFPDKSQLIEELFEEKVDELVAVMERAVADPDPWHGVVSFLEGANELQSRDFALRDLVINTPDGLARSCAVRERLVPLGDELINRAKAAGQLREDIEPGDIAVIQLMLSSVIGAARDTDPNLWRRYLAILIQGLRANPGPPEPLPNAALAPEDVDRVMSTAKFGAR
jgi:AcrR family transcriptional regulator